MRARFVVGLLFAACGYRFVAGHPLPAGVHAIDVPLFHNATSTTGAETQFAGALRDELALQGILATANPDATLLGELTELRFGPAVFYPVDGGFSLGTYRVDAVARVRLLRGTEQLAQAEVRGSEDVLRGVGGDPLGTEAGYRAAVRRLAQSMMREALHRLRTDF